MARAGSAEAAIAAMRGTDPMPPEHVKLRERDWPFWFDIVRVRAREEWTPMDLIHAANLARCLSDIEKLSQEMGEDGATLVNDRGTVVANPRHAILETLSRRSVTLTKTLHLHASALGVKPSDMEAKRRDEQVARETQADDFAGDNLLATPGLQ